MENIKDDNYYLRKILKDALFIIDNTKNLTEKEILSNDILIDSIMFRLIQIAENSNKLTEQFKNDHPELKLVNIKGIRNRIVHDYGNVNYIIIYEAVKFQLPDLVSNLQSILK